MEERIHPRHKVFNPVLVAVRKNEEVCIGSLLDISRGGLQMCVDWRKARSMPCAGSQVAVEIQLDEQVVEANATVVRTDGQRLALRVAPEFDESFLGVLMGADYSYVRWASDTAFVHGCVSHALSRDLFEATRRGLPLDLRHATSLNARALGTLQAVLQRGGVIRNCSPNIRTSMRMATGLCATCRGCGNSADVPKVGAIQK